DQIYADEIPTLLMPELNRLGGELLGARENLTAKEISSGATIPLECTMENFPTTRRARTVVENAKFSTDEGANHLLSFGEFAATYLMFWNNEVWPVAFYDTEENLQSKLDFLDIWDADPLTDLEKRLAPLDADEQKDIDKETAAKRIEKRKEKA